ncbi:hypothetical protein FLACOL7796_04521 [Flavobacterium collinsii]|uniref:Uncharacterized protein n=1 Tax=Flavobacterium collinsii TaxID=1114861 RepID=A0ABN7ES86_9FLAO|nr:hypothetical protein FLACOL7796_04521 [Flavobacterium collinsii]
MKLKLETFLININICFAFNAKLETLNLKLK